jgi:TolB protein
MDEGGGTLRRHGKVLSWLGQSFIVLWAVLLTPALGQSSKIVFTIHGTGHIVNPDGSNSMVMNFLDPEVERLHPGWKEAWRRFQRERFNMGQHGSSGELIITQGEKPYIRTTDGQRLGIWDSHPPLQSNPVWSPNRTTLAFSSSKDGDYDIYIVQADGSQEVNVSDNSVGDYRPVWSPDGSSILYDSTEGGSWDVWSVSLLDGAYRKTNLSHTPEVDDMGGVWSPTGHHIVYHGPEGAPQALYLMKSDGTFVGELAESSPGHFEWSPDGSHIAFDSITRETCDVFVVGVEAGEAVNLSTNRSRNNGCGEFAWSPDSQRLAFISDRTGSDNVFTSLTDGSMSVQITDSSERKMVVAWFSME